MPRHCCVPLCTSDSRLKKHKGITFHVFPKDEDLKKIWIRNIRRDPGPQFSITKNTYVCSVHFQEEDYCISGIQRLRKRLKIGSAPTKFSWTETKLARRILVKQPAPRRTKKCNGNDKQPELHEDIQEMVSDVDIEPGPSRINAESTLDAKISTPSSSSDELTEAESNTPTKQEIYSKHIQVLSTAEMNVKFSNMNFDVKLIDSVKHYTFLYDNSNREFKNWKMRELAWAEIAQLIGTTAGACQARWCSLRSRFMRDYDKIQHRREVTQNSEILQKMEFLKNVLDKRKLPHRQHTRESARVHVDVDETNDSDANEEQDQYDVEVMPNFSSDVTMPRIYSVRSLSKMAWTSGKMADTNLDLKFFASILPQIKKLPVLDFLEVKRKFMEDVIAALQESGVY